VCLLFYGKSKHLKTNYPIGIGLDVLTTKTLPNKLYPFVKILGRPIGLSYELQQYFEVLLGENIIENISFDDRTKQLCHIESFFTISSLVQSFRKLFYRSLDIKCSSELDSLCMQGIKLSFFALLHYMRFYDTQTFIYSDAINKLKSIGHQEAHDIALKLDSVRSSWTHFLNISAPNEKYEFTKLCLRFLDLLYEYSIYKSIQTYPTIGETQNYE
jgi:hypothetical protein